MRRTAGANASSGAARYPARAAFRTLLVNELYPAIQGEGPEQGYPTVLVRLTGCNLRCGYCDSAHAFYRGTRRAIRDVAADVAAFGIRRVLVTGGEPLAQSGTPALCRALLRRGHAVSVETNGSYDLSALPGAVRKVVDVKTPGSGEEGSFDAGILGQLSRGDVLKFVCADREDYLWARRFLEGPGSGSRACVVFMPVWNELEARELARWVLEDRMPVRVQVQLHKVLWGDRRGV